MSAQLAVAEAMVLPTRDRVRFMMMSGTFVDCLISEVKFVKEERGRLFL
jgi:hypothetical protein